VKKYRHRIYVVLLCTCCALTIVCALVFPVYLKSFLLSQGASKAIVDQGEDFYWSPVQFQIALERFSGEVSRVSFGTTSMREIEKRYDLLVARYKILLTMSEIKNNKDTAVVYAQTMYLIGDFLKKTEPYIKIYSNKSKRHLLNEIDSLRPQIIKFSTLTREEELKIREWRVADVLEKRRVVYAVGFALWLFIAGAAVLIFLKIRKNKRELNWNQELLQREQEARLAAIQAQEAKNIFMASVSHEIRSPLQSILSNVEALESELEQDVHCEKFITRIQSSTNHLIAQINDLLDNAQLSEGKLTLNLEVVNLTSIIKDVCNAHVVVAESKKIAFHVDADNLIPIRSDAQRLRQIVWNLVSNSVRYTDKGSIDVFARIDLQGQKQAFLTISVKDSGIGIPKEFLDKLFHRFAQLPNRCRGGSGLGLAITKGLVDLFGGDISVFSEIEKGTEFLVKMPVESALQSTPMSSATILLVEDDELVSEGFTCALKNMGCIVTHVNSVREAIEKVGVARYDAIILDMQLGDGDGFDVSEKLASGPNLKTPIIAVTANKDFLDDVRAERFSIKLRKPIQQATLKEAVLNVMSVC